MVMKIFEKKWIGLIFLQLSALNCIAQVEAWTYNKCIEYALSQNIDIKQAALNMQQYEINYRQSKSNLLPSVNASVSQSFGLQKNIDETTGEYGSYGSASSTSYGINASATGFSGFKMKNQIEQSQLQWESSKYYSETIKESVELNILNAYLAILYAQEEVVNAEKQIEATEQQLELTKERFDLGLISRSDYLEVKSEMASEKLTLAKARSTLAMEKLNLMQLMELPVTGDFQVVFPDIEKLLPQITGEDAGTVYQQALQNKPQIKEAEYKVKSTVLDEKIARAGLYPSLSISAGVNTGWSSSQSGYSYGSQLSNSLNPNAGFTLSIPIFQKNQVKNNIKIAQINIQGAQLEETNTKNSLRKEIEQAVTDLNTAGINYLASIEQYEASKEAYAVATEKYEQGILNSVDFMLVKNSLISAESTLLQTKYNLLFSSKIIDFYKGYPIQFEN